MTANTRCEGKLEDQMVEEWRTIPSRPDYAASSLGRVKRITGNILEQRMNKQGYLFVCMSHNGKRINGRVNRLVCEAFHGEPFEGAAAAHRNGNRVDNSSANLYWATYSENEQDKYAHGTRGYGAQAVFAKLTTEQVAIIRSAPVSRNKKRLAGGQAKALAAQFNVHRATISDVFHGRKYPAQPPARAALPEKEKRGG
jgi:hypothetical protein